MMPYTKQELPETVAAFDEKAVYIEQRLLNNSIRYQRLKKTGAPMKPLGVSIAVTGRCNSHCIMCSIWKIGKENPDLITQEMTVDEILGYLSDPYMQNLVEIDLTGGEPYLRDDLEAIIFGIVDLKLKHGNLKKLQTIIVPSNGYLTDKILTTLERVLARLKGLGIDFVPVSSLDGIGNTHDIIRGTRGAFEKQKATIDGMVELRKIYSDFFFPMLKSTIMHANVNELEELFHFASQRQMFPIISSVIISKKRFRNDKYRSQLELTAGDQKKIATFYADEKKDLDFYYKKIFESIISGEKQWTCTALFDYVFIDYDRKVYPCPIQDACVGDLRYASLSEILTSPGAAEIRKKVGSMELCRQCTEPGSVRYSQIMEGGAMLDFIKAKGRMYYKQMIFDRGLHKLLEV
ncbi:MAG: radical SAM/SPASM domain-containing protein [Desulfobacterales bacterium]|nr:radical SAM/SPASM domain-containing protein [Desulfobacterales bacterium]MDD4072443.1 radical SAM/SPASM domain-containing protein [Desulfobacterales bacterium]MDD4392727.1 radical SAM/SPASM domain-containing protein [Desulfobacterales bacterium]